MKRRRWYRRGGGGRRGRRAVGGGLRAWRARPSPKLTKVTIQLKWVDAGAVRRLLRREGEGLLQGGGPRRQRSRSAGRTSSPSRSCSAKQAEFGVNWLAEPARATATQGNDLVNIAQVYTRSRHDRGDLEEGRASTRSRRCGQEVRRLDLRQRVRAARGARQERDRPGQGRDARQAELRHGRVPEAARSTLPRR